MKDEFLSILHAPDFTSVLSHHTYSGELAEIMKFYVNLRDAVQNRGGALFALKQKYDALNSATL